VPRTQRLIMAARDRTLEVAGENHALDGLGMTGQEADLAHVILAVPGRERLFNRHLAVPQERITFFAGRYETVGAGDEGHAGHPCQVATLLRFLVAIIEIPDPHGKV